MRALITGGAGFIGSHLAETLLAILGGGIWLISAILKPIRQAVVHFERIAEGDLTDEIANHVV